LNRFQLGAKPLAKGQDFFVGKPTKKSQNPEKNLIFFRILRASPPVSKTMFCANTKPKAEAFTKCDQPISHKTRSPLEA
jgi:hypothetical protein